MQKIVLFALLFSFQLAFAFPPGSVPLKGQVAPHSTASSRISQYAPANSHLSYFGGKIVEHPTYVNVFWGAYWTSGTGLTERNHMNGFTQTVATSAEFASVLNQYTQSDGKAVQAGTYVGEVLISSEPGGTSKTITDAQVASAI